MNYLSLDTTMTKYYWTVICITLIYLPPTCMTIALVFILLQMNKFEAELRRSYTITEQFDNTLTMNMRYRRHIIEILFIYLLVSIICWSPLQGSIIYRFVKRGGVNNSFHEFNFFCQLIVSLSSALNPIIFGFLSQPFRQVINRIWNTIRQFFFGPLPANKSLANNGPKVGSPISIPVRLQNYKRRSSSRPVVFVSTGHHGGTTRSNSHIRQHRVSKTGSKPSIARGRYHRAGNSRQPTTTRPVNTFGLETDMTDFRSKRVTFDTPV